MNEAFFAELSAWLTQAGLAGSPETAIVSGFCDRCAAAGLPLARSMLFIDTLHPVHEGRLFRWGYSPAETPLLEYGRTSPEALAASGSDPRDVETAERWRRSPHYRMLQTRESFWRRRLDGATEDEFWVLAEWRAEGMTDYVAIITRFAAEGVIGEMDGVYSAWATRDPEGFTEDQITALKRIVPYLGHAIKSVSLARMIRTLMETYLGRDAGRRVLSGRIVRGIAEQIDAVIWSSNWWNSRHSRSVAHWRQSESLGRDKGGARTLLIVIRVEPLRESLHVGGDDRANLPGSAPGDHVLQVEEPAGCLNSSIAGR
jgi:adenylate cyclase